MSQLNEARDAMEAENDVLEAEIHDGMLMVAVNRFLAGEVEAGLVGVAGRYGLDVAGQIDDEAQIEEVGAPESTDVIMVFE